MEIDTKRFTVMIVGLAVAIILVSGLMIPVISSLGGSGTYTNTGEYYYKTPVEGETHTIATLYDTEENLPTGITYDETLIVDLKGEQGFAVPVLLYTSSRTGHDMLYTITFTRDMNFDTGELWPELYGNGVIQDVTQVDENGGESGEYNASIDGKDITITKRGNSRTYDEGEVKFFIADKGDLVLSESPVIKEDTTYYLADMYQIKEFVSSEESTQVNYGVAGKGTSGGMSVLYPVEYFGMYKNSVSYSLDESSVTTQIDKTENEYGIKMNGIEIHSVWKNSTDATQTIDIDWTAKKMIVPVTVESDGGSGISDTLMSLISVIPLITVVGIVLGAITILRRK